MASRPRSRSGRKWNSRCATGTTSPGCRATTSWSSTCIPATSSAGSCSDEPPLHAWGYGGRQVRIEAKCGDIFDHHAVVYEYASGARVYALHAGSSPAASTTCLLTVLGTKGRLTRGTARLRASSTIEGDANGRGVEQDEATRSCNTFREMFAGMRAGKPINDSLSMARSTMLAILGRMATHSGQQVTWEEAFASNRVLARRVTLGTQAAGAAGRPGPLPRPDAGRDESAVSQPRSRIRIVERNPGPQRARHGPSAAPETRASDSR